MATLVYLHGFLSSPRSVKAEQTRAWLASNRPDLDYRCPFLPSYPAQARACLDQLMACLEGEQVGLVGSSLGGFWATYLAERYGLKAVLVNPAVRPQDRFVEFVGQPLKNYHTDDEYQLKEADLQALIAADMEHLRDLSHYWVMLQTGDETLDYRQAQAKYAGARMLVQEGGNHSFEGYVDWLPNIVDFLLPR